MRRERQIDRAVHHVTEFASTSHFLKAETVPAGISTIYENGLPIDLLISPAGSDTTIFFFHGAIESHFNLPVLSGLGISGGLEANRVFVSDPSLVLDEKLMLAWYAGNFLQPDLQALLKKIFQKIISSLGSSRTVFFGGSGGGFASLYFASQFPSSLALVFNPQTNIVRYQPRAVEYFARGAFGVKEPNQDALLSELPAQVVTDLSKPYAAAPKTTVAYIQNTNDEAHVKNHLKPFSGIISEPTEFLLLAGPWGQGHSAPPKHLLTTFLNIAASSKDWADNYYEVGFKNR